MDTEEGQDRQKKSLDRERQDGATHSGEHLLTPRGEQQ
jgi:hypothetical protein